MLTADGINNEETVDFPCVADHARDLQWLINDVVMDHEPTVSTENSIAYSTLRYPIPDNNETEVSCRVLGLDGSNLTSDPATISILVLCT